MTYTITTASGNPALDLDPTRLYTVLAGYQDSNRAELLIWIGPVSPSAERMARQLRDSYQYHQQEPTR